MHVGMATVFQNTGRALSDHQIYLNELALADMAEPLGFESIWGTPVCAWAGKVASRSARAERAASSGRMAAI